MGTSRASKNEIYRKLGKLRFINPKLPRRDKEVPTREPNTDLITHLEEPSSVAEKVYDKRFPKPQLN